MRVLVAGGGGFIGSHLVDALLAAGRQVTIVDTFLTGRRRNLAHIGSTCGLTIVEADITDPWCTHLLDGPFDRIYHLASPASPEAYRRYPLETLRVNSAGTDRLLDLARTNGARFLLASTSEIYGNPVVHPQSETYWGNVNPIGPRSCYDEGKRFAESLAITYATMHGVDVRIARIFNTYGPRTAPQDGRRIPNLCVQALTGAPLTIYGDGSQTRSFCYVTDLVRGLISLMETAGMSGEVVNLGNPAELPVRSIAEAVVAAAGRRVPIEYRPLPPDDPARRRPDIAKASQLLGWRPRVDLDEGLRHTLEFFRIEIAQLRLPAVAAEPPGSDGETDTAGSPTK